MLTVETNWLRYADSGEMARADACCVDVGENAATMQYVINWSLQHHHQYKHYCLN